VHKHLSFVKQTDGVHLRRELDGLGGRQAYQEASVLTTTRHRTCKWVFAMITRLGLRPGKQSPPLRLLEVGAVNTQLMSVPWLAVRAIDIQESRLGRWSFPPSKHCSLFSML
jgi:25S rRNA (adenine2142-N1)-methyltransferase